MLKRIKKTKHLKEILIFVFLTAVVVFIFGGLTEGFIKQERWLAAGRILASGKDFIFGQTKGLLRIILGEGRILARLVTYLLMVKNPLDIFPSAVFAISVHSFNTFLVYILAKRVVKSHFPALFGALFFAVNGVSFGTLTFPAAVVVTLPATTLILIALIKYFDYIRTPIIKTSFLALFLFLLLSLYFKEVGFFLFLFLPFAYLIYKRISLKQLLEKYWYFIVFFVFVLILRIGSFKAISTPVALYLTGANQNFFATLAARNIFYPLTSFSLVYIPASYFVTFARWFTNIYYPFFPASQFILISETIVLDLLSVFLSVLIFVCLYGLRKKASKKEREHIVFWVLFTLTSFTPYTIVAKSFSYLDSRFYYLSVVGAGVILAWTLHVLGKIIKKRSYIGFVILIPLGLLFLFTHASVIRAKIRQDIILGEERRLFLKQIKEIKPNLDGRNIFYITSDSDYYVQGNKVPFQSGIGHTLMVWYYDTGEIPKDLLREGFLFEIGSQGYQEIGERGFGYFSDFDELVEAFAKGDLSTDSITAMYYDVEQKVLVDITQQTISKLR